MPFFINPSTCLIGPTFSTDDYCNPWFVNHSLVLCPQMEMNYQVTEIEFDFDDAADEELTEQDRIDLYDDYIGTFWEADDGDDLVEEITAASGWCIKSIDYRHILN